MRNYRIKFLIGYIFLFGLFFLPVSAQAGCCECGPPIIGPNGTQYFCGGGENNLNFQTPDSCDIFCLAAGYQVPPNSNYPIFSHFCNTENSCPIVETVSCCVYFKSSDNTVTKCTDGLRQDQCKPEVVPVTLIAKYHPGESCEEIKCDEWIGQNYFDVQQAPSAKVSKPVTFTPQVTIPGSVEFGGKVFTINKGQGIEVNGELLSKYIALLFNWLIGAIGVVVVAYMAFGGMQWLAAAGSAKGINKAKETIRDSIVGLLLVVSSYTVLYFINPNLVGFNPFKIDEVEGITLIGSDVYEKITGTRLVKPFSEEMKKSMRQVSQANNIHYCVLATLFTKESSGRVDALGHDENVRKEGIKSRRDFVNSGCLMYSDKKSNAVCSITGAAVNDDVVNPNRADLGLDWRFSHGIGLGQITVFPDGPACNGAPHCRQIGSKLYDPKSLFTLDINLDAVTNLWKEICPADVTQDCFRKYNGSGPAAEEYGRDAWAIYNNCLTQNP